MEAQAAGTPVITTNASAMAEINPYGIAVDGQPFWNGVHKGWWISPNITQIAESYEQAYQDRKGVDHKKLRRFAQKYAYPKISEKYMQPAITELLNRMEAKKIYV
jgi:glycosyltransferase involved in cell wall biosynthesis